MENVIRWARKCDVTGKGMNQGFCFGDGEAYFINESDAKKYAKEIGYKSLKEAYKDGAYYWTEWDEDDEDDMLFVELPNGEVVSVDEIDE
jgi:hypothetical protein